MSKKKIFFDKCGVSINRGLITISTDNYYSFEKHYNVDVEIDEETNCITVTGEKAIFDLNFLGSKEGREDLYLNTEFKEYKSWFGLGPVRYKLKEGLIERIERKTVSYYANNFIIVNEG